MVKQLTNIDLQNSSKIINVPTPTASGDLVRLQDLQAAIATLQGVTIQVPTDLDASTNPDYPVSEPGQSYYITAAGTVGGATVNIGDQIICKNPAGSPGGGAAVAGDFFIVESNRDQATETELGVATLATQTEVNNGTVNNKIVTPLTLNTRLNNAFNSRKYATAIGDGTNSTFLVTHSLNDPNVLVQIKESNAPFELVNADIAFVDANTVQISFLNPPTTNQFTVSIR